MKLTYDKIVDLLDIKKIAGSTILPGKTEISDLNLILKFLLPVEIKTKYYISRD